MLTWLHNDIEALKSQHLYRHAREIASPQSRDMVVDGKVIINFCSNDYLGLANDPRLKEAGKRAIDQWGAGAGASRLVSGNQSPSVALETTLAAFKKTEAALVFSCGYMANIGIIPALVGRNDVVFSDRLNHASIVDGIILSRAHLRRYPHADVDALKRMLKATPSTGRRLIVTDTVFSMDGDIAPLQDIVALAREHGAMVLVDEAHALGLLGHHGAGLVEHLWGEDRDNLDDVLIQMGTLSKAAGVYGAYVAGSLALKEFLVNHARAWIYTTALPACVLAQAQCALEIIRNDPSRRQRVCGYARQVRESLQAMGFHTLNSSTAIIPVVLGDAAKALKASQFLWERGIFVQAIRPPTVPQGTARLRLTVSAGHTQEDIDTMLAAFHDMRQAV